MHISLSWIADQDHALLNDDAMPGWIDHLFVALILVAAPIDSVVELRRLQRDIAEGKPNAKFDAYARIMRWQWAVAVILLVSWVLAGRSITSLGIVVPQGTRFLLATLLVTAITFVLARQVRSARRSVEFAATVREAAASLAFVTPSTYPEMRRFTWVGITAGIVEELIFRGYVVWYFSAFVPLWSAIVITAMAFGIGHAYQGLGGMLKTGAVGLFLGFLYWFSGSIWAPMFLHAATDVLQGRLIYFASSGSATAAPIAERR